MKKKVLITKYGTPIELIPAIDWHCAFSFRNWRIGASFEESMWQFDLLWFYVWCDRYNKRGKVLNSIPKGADVTVEVSPISRFKGA